MSLYPSLEDMKVDHMAKVQMQHMPPQQPTMIQQTGPSAPPAYAPTGAPPVVVAGSSSLYPSLNDYMGLQITSAVIQQHMPETGQAVVQYQPSANNRIVAPITGEQNLGMMRAEVKQGVRMIIACKDGKGKVGLRVRHINKGVFISFVETGSPAAMAGLRFGDQILQINGTTLAGFESDKVNSLIKKADPKRIEFAVRERPFERSITLQKDSVGHVGFVFKDNKIKSIVKDSSAARNGLLTEHHVLEVNGQNVVGLKEKDISEILQKSDRSITLTIMPSFIYEHMVKCMADSLVKKKMDHSIPDL